MVIGRTRSLAALRIASSGESPSVFLQVLGQVSHQDRVGHLDPDTEDDPHQRLNVERRAREVKHRPDAHQDQRDGGMDAERHQKRPVQGDRHEVDDDHGQRQADVQIAEHLRHA